MKKLLKSLILFLSCILITFSVTACANNEKKLVGTWTLESVYDKENGMELNIEQFHGKLRNGVSVNDPEYRLYKGYEDAEKIEFFSDGTCTVDGEYGTWKIVDDKLMLLGPYGGDFWDAQSITGEFKVSGNKLKFFDANDTETDLVYKKSN